MLLLILKLSEALHALFYKLHFCKQRQAEIGKKNQVKA